MKEINNAEERWMLETLRDSDRPVPDWVVEVRTSAGGRMNKRHSTDNVPPKSAGRKEE